MKNEDIIATARKRMSEAVTADEDNRKAALDDLECLAGEGQWDETIRTQREADGRPCLTINRLPQFSRQVTGDLRRMNPAIKVLAADSTATPEIAEIYEGLTRHIEYRSSATNVYEGAAESAAQCGIGNFRVRAEYEDPTSFDQELLIERIHNPFAVYWDPAARDATRRDAEWCFITEQMSHDDFKEAYPNADPEDVEADGNTDGLQNWHDEGSVIVAEYFWREYKTVTLGQLADGSVVEDPSKLMNVVKTRKTKKPVVKWAKVSGQEVLEGPEEFPCRYIPVVAVTGEEMQVEDKIIRTSVIRHAKDAQRMYNYASSTQTEVIALQPKAPFIGTVNQFAGLEKHWAAANRSTAAFLPYNPDTKAPGPPLRSQPPVASQGLAAEIAKAAEDMKATTGIYDAGLGNRSSETSGVAIRQRQMESDTSTSIYADNLAKSIEQCGRIVVDMIPRVYDTERVVRLVGDDDQEKMETINALDFQLTAYGDFVPVKVNHLDIGRYDVRVSVGPNYATRRQETAESMMQFVQAFPPAGQVAGDLMAKAMDWPDADKIAERLRKTLPPGIISPDELEPEEQQAMLQQQQAAQQEQQAQMQAAQQAQQIEMRKSNAEASEAEAQAQEAAFDTMLKQLEVSAQTGAIQSAIQQAVTQALMASLQQG